MSRHVPVNRQGIPQHWMRHAEDYLEESLQPRSASEKLKGAAPWDQWREYCNSDVLDMIESDDMDRLLNALPQIVAIVQAAEQLPEFFYELPTGGRTHSFVPLLDELDKALS